MVPRQYIPAVEKGLREALEEGVLAGYPVVDIKVKLVDGSYHTVDSSEMAFKIAASMAFKKGLEQAQPILLEPIVDVEVVVPEDYMGDIMGGSNGRGKIQGMEPVGMLQKIRPRCRWPDVSLCHRSSFNDSGPGLFYTDFLSL